MLNLLVIYGGFVTCAPVSCVIADCPVQIFLEIWILHSLVDVLYVAILSVLGFNSRYGLVVD
jgi:hypothetical protein